MFCFYCLENCSCHLGAPESFKMHFRLTALQTFLESLQHHDCCLPALCFLFCTSYIIWYFLSACTLWITKFVIVPFLLLSELWVWSKKKNQYTNIRKIPIFKNKISHLSSLIPHLLLATDGFAEKSQAVVSVSLLPTLCWTNLNEALSLPLHQHCHLSKSLTPHSKILPFLSPYPFGLSIHHAFDKAFASLSSSKPTLKFIQLIINHN